MRFRSHLEVVRDIIFAGARLSEQRLVLIRRRRLGIARRVGVVHRVARRGCLVFGVSGHRVTGRDDPRGPKANWDKESRLFPSLRSPALTRRLQTIWRDSGRWRCQDDYAVR